MAGTSDLPASTLPFDRPYTVRDGVVDARPGPEARLPRRGAAGWVNDLRLTAWAYEPLWRHRSLRLLTFGATRTAHELATLRRWLAVGLGAADGDATGPAGAAGALVGRRVLDVGCSSGLYARTLAADGATVAALDASRAFVAATARRAARAGLDVVPVLGDAHALPFRDGAFDAVALGATGNELGDPRRAWAELGRVLRDGGVAWTMYVARGRGLGRGLQVLLERGGLRFPSPEAVDADAAAAGLALLRRARFGPVVFALYRKGAGAPPVAVSSPIPGWEAGPGAPAGVAPHSPTT